jgi:hypothetical protein
LFGFLTGHDNFAARRMVILDTDPELRLSVIDAERIVAGQVGKIDPASIVELNLIVARRQRSQKIPLP